MTSNCFNPLLAHWIKYTHNGDIYSSGSAKVFPRMGPAAPQWAVIMPWADKMMLKKSCSLLTINYMMNLLLIADSRSCISFGSGFKILSVTHSMWPGMVGWMDE
jgi:hypothetical protein